MKAIVPAWRANSVSHNLFNEFDHIFDSFFDRSLAPSRSTIACDIEESDKHVLLSFDLPGIDESDINIEIKDSVLQVSAERKEMLNEDSTRRFRGRRYGQFQQRFALPKSVDQDAVEADYTNGVLKIALPKKELEQPKRVEVKAKKNGFFSDLLPKSKEA